MGLGVRGTRKPSSNKLAPTLLHPHWGEGTLKNGLSNTIKLVCPPSNCISIGTLYL